MDPITQQTVLAAAGAAGGDPVYVDDVFSTFLYEGNGVNGRNIINNIDINGEGGLVWTKARNHTYEHNLVNTETGVNSVLQSNDAAAALTYPFVSQFNSNGYGITNVGAINANNQPFVSWTFRKAPGFFDVVTYAGSGSGTKTISHNLGSVPGMIIVKGTNGGSDWSVYHRSLNGGSSPEDYYLRLNGTNAESNAVANWGGTAPTSTEFTVGENANASLNYVAYVFAHDDASFGTDEDESIIKCGSVNNNGSQVTDVNLGFEPQFIIIKNSSVSENWFMFDVMRGMDVNKSSKLFPNKSNAEDIAGYAIVYPTATGFSLSTASAGDFPSGNYVYMAIRRPHKPPEAATEVFALHSQTAPQNSWTPGFVPDSLIFNNYTVGGYNRFWASRLQSGAKWLYTNKSDSEYPSGNNTAYIHWDDPTNTIRQNYYQGGSASWINYAFKRAPGFFDVVTYTGTGSVKTENHNLEAVPELMIVKIRSTGDSWTVYDKVNGATNYMLLNSTNATNPRTAMWNDTTPTDTVFTLGDDNGVNYNGQTFIAYLFATLPGISKVGTYDGSSSDIDVDCGFTNGARFVLIKRTDANGDWCVFDTSRGIVIGNDAVLKLNGSAAQDTGNDLIDPLSSGFTIPGGNSFVNNVNAGAKYLFLAIA